MKEKFIHLRLHSEYSLLDSIVRIEDAILAALNDNMYSLALTDLSNVFGLVKFYKAARKKGIKPIIGSDVWITNPDDRNKPYRLQLLVKNYQGYLNLCRLLSDASLLNQYKGRSEINSNWFLEKRITTGLIALSGARSGDIGIALLNNNLIEAKKKAIFWKNCFDEDFYVEIQRAGHFQDEEHVFMATNLAVHLDLPVVATHPIQFMSRSDFIAHETRVCIADGDILSNTKRVKKFTIDQYFKTQIEMLDLFRDLPIALENSIEIAKCCNLHLTLNQVKLPNFPIPKNITIDHYFMDQATKGLSKNLIHLYSDPKEREKKKIHYIERLKFEGETISSMGFSGYFLIVADFINWAKKNNIPVGPGRGSGASSLIAYSLGITDLDPLTYNLLFERFLNPERVSMPDFDIDFCQYGRDKVIAYVKEKYGKNSVSQIATFGTLTARAAIRDVGRALGHPYGFVDSIAKLIPNKPGQAITIAQAKINEKYLSEREEKEEEVRQLLELAQRLEGIVRNVSMHAGGVLIAPGRLIDFCPLYSQNAKDSENLDIISQYDKDDIESLGLVKFDFLGLTALTIISKTEDYIRTLYKNKGHWKIQDIPIDDISTFELLKNGNTIAVFQLESRGMQAMIQEAKPNCFEDIIALIALYRPGPMDLISSYIARKHKKEKIQYPDPRLEYILKETYGIIVYQEQVMQIAQIIGNYSLGHADLLRRAMGKKKPEEMAKHRAIFTSGAKKNNVSMQKANEIFDLMEKFAGYGFNKSHAAAYALLSYRTAWLKSHYLSEFMASNMSLAMDDIDKVKILYKDAIDNNLEILPPDINESHFDFKPIKQSESNKKKTICYGLGAIRGLGKSAIEMILCVRKEKRFSDFFDFCMRIDRKTINRRGIEALIRAGAFDNLHKDYNSRNVLLYSIEKIMNTIDQMQNEAMQISLFEKENNIQKIKFIETELEIWDTKRRLKEEKSALGLHLSGHLFNIYRKELSNFIHTQLNQLTIEKSYLVSGIIQSIRFITGIKGNWVIVWISDSFTQIEIVISKKIFESCKHWIKEDELIIAQVSVIQNKFFKNTRVIAENIINIATARLKYGKYVSICIECEINIKNFKKELKEYCNKKGDLEGLSILADVSINNTFCQVKFSDEWKIYPDDDRLFQLNKLLKNMGLKKEIEIKYQ